MKIKFKNTTPVPFGYELDELTSDAKVGFDGPFTHIQLNFLNLDMPHTISFDIRGNGLFTKIDIRSFARRLKNKDIAECIEESLKFVRMKGTILHNGYISIIEHTPIEVIESLDSMMKIYKVIPKHIQPMADLCFKKRVEDKKKLENLKISK